MNSGIDYLSTDAGVLPSESHHQDGHLRHRRSTGHHFLHLSSRSSPTVQSFGVFCFIFDEHAGMSMIRFYFVLTCSLKNNGSFPEVNSSCFYVQASRESADYNEDNIHQLKSKFQFEAMDQRFCVFRFCVFRFLCVEIDATGHQNLQPNDCIRTRT